MPTPEVGLLASAYHRQTRNMSDLRERVPGHSLIDELLRQWDVGAIHVDATSDAVVIDDEAVSWYRGVIGERRVATLLATLGDGHTVLHSVPVGRLSADIDHVVISPAGVFTVNTKYSPGKPVWSAGFGLYVDGHSQSYVRNSINEARRAGELLAKAAGLTVPVTALIVFVDPEYIDHKAPAGGSDGDPDVRVLTQDELLRAVSGRPVFSEEQVARIIEAAVLPQTWHKAPKLSTVGRHITREFEALEEAVGPRLARPVVAPSRAQSVARSNRPAARRPASSRPAARSNGARSRNRRRKESPLESLFKMAAFFTLAAVVYGIYMNYVAG